MALSRLKAGLVVSLFCLLAMPLSTKAEEPQFRIGTAILGDLKYQQFRAGLHLTGFRALGLEWSVGAGYVLDTDGQMGPYGRIGLNHKQ